MVYIQMPVGKESVLPELGMRQRIVAEVTEYFETTNEQLQSSSRKRVVCTSRMFIYYLLRKYTTYTYVFIGSFYNRDHSNVIRALNELSDLCDTDERMVAALDYVEKRILI